jgi:ComF family protein
MFLHDIFNFILPSYCGICKKLLQGDEKGVCDECFNSIEVIVPPFCVRCGKNSKHSVCNECIISPHEFTRARALGRYRGVLKELILLFKGRRKLSIGKRLGKLLGRIIENDEIISKANLLVPVPLYPVIKRIRGYNQSEILCNEISKITGIPILINAISQVKPTKPQKTFSSLELTPKEQKKLRQLNVKNAFKVKYPCRIKNQRILLVDDVCTTGATLDECAKELYKEGAKEVYVAVAARV